ncbi:hypothetical protein [Roseobacter sp.]|uniref:hypothetical protein n=1 Tax=Roseobacter sp. TaxID=1907202 RepID=UPI0032972B50
MTQAVLIFLVLRVWGYVGAAVALVFLTVGIDRVDEDARGAYMFRPLLIPAVLVIWPLVLWRWYVYETGRDQWPRRYDPPRRAHFAVGWILPIGICAIIAAGLSQRQIWPADVAPVHMSSPAQVAE